MSFDYVSFECYVVCLIGLWMCDAFVCMLYFIIILLVLVIIVYTFASVLYIYYIEIIP